MESNNDIMNTPVLETPEASSSTSTIKSVLTNPITYGVLAVFLAVYGPKITTKLPKPVVKTLNNNFFRFIIIALIAYLGTKDLQLSLILAIGFLLILSLAMTQDVTENFESYKNENFNNMINNYNTYVTEGFESNKDSKKMKDDKTDVEVKREFRDNINMTKDILEMCKNKTVGKDKLTDEQKDRLKDFFEEECGKLHKNKTYKDDEHKETPKKDSEVKKNEKTTVGDAVGNLINAMSTDKKDKKEKFETMEEENVENYENYQESGLESYENYLNNTINSYKFNYA